VDASRLPVALKPLTDKGCGPWFVTGALRWGGPRQTIQIEHGTITAVDATAPKGATILGAPLITAGFVDAHGHLALLGDRLATLDLTGVASYRETIRRVASAPPASGWLLGCGWDQNLWADAPAGGWPTATDLDTVAPQRPTLLLRVDQHAAWLNSAALRVARITGDTPDPAGGRIVRSARGQPSGVLIDSAVDLVTPPTADRAEQLRRLRLAIGLIASHGLTGVHDMAVDDEALEIYEQLDAAGEIPIRVWAYVQAGCDAAKRMIHKGPWCGEHLSVVGIKAFADGALGSRGALLSDPYADDPAQTGLERMGADALAALAQQCLAAGTQLAVHCIGDKAVRNALRAFQHARRVHPECDHIPLRIEHAQIVDPTDLPQMAQTGVIASVQPTHATSDMAWTAARIGARRLSWAHAWRSLLNAGIPLALGSDFPIEHVSPSLGIWAAVTRTDGRGEPRGGWLGEQRLTLQEAIDGFTSGSARAVGCERRVGQLQPGQRADLSLWEVAGTIETPRLTPAATVVGGQLVWQSSA
jgi:predicted amidohydrolase YtcJ